MHTFLNSTCAKVKFKLDSSISLYESLTHALPTQPAVNIWLEAKWSSFLCLLFGRTRATDMTLRH